MSERKHRDSRARRSLSGTATGVLACAVATLAVLAVALQVRPAGTTPITYRLSDTTVLAEPGFDARSAISADEWLRRFYRTGDARYLNFAKAALDGAASRSRRDDITRIRLESAAHRFRSAAVMATILIEREPRNAEARLLRVEALRRAGDLSGARRDCVALAIVGDALAGRGCAVQLLLSAGRVNEAYSEAQTMTGVEILAADAVQRWSLQVAAEAAAHAGDYDGADAIYRQLVGTGRSHFSTRLGYADLLLQQRRPDAVTLLLDEDTGRLPAQVRIAIAMKQRGDGPDPRLHAAIATAFEGMSADVTTDLRLRDRAIFELHYTGDLRLALRYALANWEQQKGPEDRSLLRDAATAADDGEVLAIVNRWESRFAIEGES